MVEKARAEEGQRQLAAAWSWAINGQTGELAHLTFVAVHIGQPFV